MPGILLDWVIIIIPLLIGVGFSVMSTTPPEFTLAKWCFTLSFLILAARLGWWIAVEQTKEFDNTKAACFAFVLFGILGVLWTGVIRWVNNRQALSLSTSNQSNQIRESQNDKTSEQLRNEQLQKRLTQPYTIRKADQEEFIRVLKLSGKLSVDIECDVNSDLTRPFAEELRTLLMLSGWEVDGPNEVLVTGRYLRGVIITVNKDEAVPVGASLLHDFLAKQEIDVELHTAPPRKASLASFYIYVGPKP